MTRLRSEYAFSSFWLTLQKINKLLDPMHPLNKQSRELVDSYNANLREISDDEAKDFREVC